MIRNLALMITAAVMMAGCGHTPGHPPTQTGDVIGTATLSPDRVLELRLWSVECSGMIVHGHVTAGPDDPRYGELMAWAGQLSPGESGPVRAQEAPPCPRARPT